jgi:CubicO group peptidase (beta-lactamase class C family)
MTTNMNLRSRIAPTAALTAALTFIAAARGLADAVDDYVEKQRQQANVPAVSLAVVRDGKVEKARGYGLADVELNVPATEHTVFQWASVTKQFTATAIMLLAQDGKLSLNDPISRYYAKSPPAWSNVTIRHLLTHTAGMTSYTDLPDFSKSLRKDYEPDDLIGLVIDRPLDFTPGDKWRYNNTAYFLLGLVIEKVSGQSYGEFLHTRIFKPLGMDTARVNHQFEIIPNRATGYANVSNRLLRAEFVSPTQPFSAGALVGTVLDLARWDAALYSDKLLPASVLAEMWTPVKLNDGKTYPYGYGWQLGDARGHRFVGHGGGIHGFSTFILRLVDDRLTVIVLCNGGANPQAIARGVATRYVPALSLASLSPQTDPDPAFSRLLEQCIHELAEKKDSDLLTPEFRDNFSRSRRRHAALQEALKDLTSFTYVTSESPKQSEAEALNVPVARVASYKLTLAQNEPRFYRFAITADKKLTWFEMEE